MINNKYMEMWELMKDSLLSMERKKIGGEVVKTILQMMRVCEETIGGSK